MPIYEDNICPFCLKQFSDEYEYFEHLENSDCSDYYWDDQVSKHNEDIRTGCCDDAYEYKRECERER